METKVITQKHPKITKNINEITIPDLWHIATRLDKPAKEMVLEVWHLCHSLKDHIQQAD